MAKKHSKKFGKRHLKATKPAANQNSANPAPTVIHHLTQSQLDRRAAKTTQKANNAAKTAQTSSDQAKTTAAKSKKPASKLLRISAWPFITIARPFRAFGRYLKASWLELRQVRWPSRKTTWQMVFSIALYVLLIGLIITLLDVGFTFLFNQVLGA